MILASVAQKWLAFCMLTGCVIALAGCNEAKQNPKAEQKSAADQAASSAGASTSSSAPIPDAATATSATTSATTASTSTSGASAAALKLNASQAIEAMAKAYQEAQIYADHGQIDMRFEVDGQLQQQTYPYLVVFERPNKLRLQINEAMLVSDGTTMTGAVDTIIGQVVELPAPEVITPIDVIRDEVIAASISNEPAQLALLLGDDALEKLGGDLSQAKLLSPEQADGRLCYRVEVPTSEQGKSIFWIDGENYVLRRLELPTDQFREQLEGSGAQVGEISLVANFTSARLNEPVEEAAFQFVVSDSTHRVKRLVQANPPNPLPEILGQTLGDYSLRTLAGDVVNRQSLAGKVVVLDFWFTNCPPCRDTMPLVDKVYQRYQGNDNVVFLAVSVDPPSINDATLLTTTQSWGSSMPIARPMGDEADRVFQITACPTLMVIDKQGNVQYSIPGIVEAELPGVIDELLNDQDVAAKVRARYEQEYNNYLQVVELGKQDIPDSGIHEVPQVEIAEKSEPSTLKLQHRWTSEAVTTPGNLLVADDKLFVLDSMNTVVVFDAEGQEVARHMLEIPELAPVFGLRTALDAAGNRFFLGVADGQQQLFVFDKDWKTVLTFPASDTPAHAGIADAQLGDINGDGQLEVVIGYWGNVGIQAVSLQGQRVWFDRSVELVLNVSPLAPNEERQRSVIASTGTGNLVVFGPSGTRQQEISLPNHRLHYVRAQQWPAPQGESLVAIALPDIGVNHAVGLNLAGQELWSLELAQGVHRSPVEKIVPGQLSAEGYHWIFPGPDGSLMFVDAASGQVFDRYNTGSVLSGVASAKLGERYLIFVATPGAVNAWEVNPTEPAAEPQVVAEPEPVVEPEPAADSEPASDVPAEL